MLRYHTVAHITHLLGATDARTFLLDNLESPGHATLIAEILSMPVGLALAWHEAKNSPFTIAAYWPQHVVGALRKGRLMYEDWGVVVVPSPVESKRATCTESEEISRAIFLNYHPAGVLPQGHTYVNDESRATCYTLIQIQSAIESARGLPSPIGQYFDVFGDYFPAAHDTKILISGKLENFDPQANTVVYRA